MKIHRCFSSLRRSLDAPSLNMMGLKGVIARMKLWIYETFLNPRWFRRILFLEFQTLLGSCGWNICACRVFIWTIWNDHLLQSHLYLFNIVSTFPSTDILVALPIWMAKGESLVRMLRLGLAIDLPAILWLTSEQQTSRPQIWAVWTWLCSAF